MMQRATVGGGCFWCTEAVYARVDGVGEVRSGYAGGRVENPTYEQVCAGTTGHAEVVQLTFDESVVDYDAILDWFFRSHDPTTLNRQGADVGTQYRSIILYHDDAQKAAAEAAIARAQSDHRQKIVTEVVALEQFYPAEKYHDDYFARNGAAPYCRAVIAPKIAKLFDR